MKRLFFLLIFLFAFKTSYAALPPLYQSLKEINAILSDKRLSDELGSSQAITGIKRIKNGYLITTFKYQLKVDVIYVPQKIMGPAKFELKFHEKKSKSIFGRHYFHHEKDYEYSNE
jgi:hypothetical protein